MLEIDTRAVAGADDGSGHVPAVGKRKMKGMPGKIRFSGIAQADIMNGKAGGQYGEEVAGSQVLQPFPGMLYRRFRRYDLVKIVSCFRDAPNSYLCVRINLYSSD
ncbi:hypothetical protein GCM10023143_27840 [Compostibacter hankyongensis]|uniref:Uncharacterized protein n=1 Tax=Compostibacter hankyongensis TaxID=1007089 RepID=A0ABP8G3F3_9BACT